MKILVIEDDPFLLRTVTRTLHEKGYAVDSAQEGESGLFKAEGNDYDLILLDVLLPKLDGWDVLKRLRLTKKTPVLMLTARDAIEDRVTGLDSGADDYLVKPFAMAELRARLRALMRRDLPDKSGELQVGDLALDPATHKVERGGKQIDLTSKEFALLEYFMRNPERLITREMAEEHVWDYDYEGVSNVIDVYIRRLRRKVDDPYKIKLLETVRGAGYRLVKPVESEVK